LASGQHGSPPDEGFEETIVRVAEIDATAMLKLHLPLPAAVIFFLKYIRKYALLLRLSSAPPHSLKIYHLDFGAPGFAGLIGKGNDDSHFPLFQANSCRLKRSRKCLLGRHSQVSRRQIYFSGLPATGAVLTAAD
jgi:hypothetical protein